MHSESLWTDFLSALTSSDPIASLIHIGVSTLNLSLYLVDYTGKVIYFELVPGDTLWRDTCQKGYLPLQLCKEIFAVHSHASEEESQKERPFLAVDISGNHIIPARLVLHCSADQLTEFDNDILQILRKSIASIFNNKNKELAFKEPASALLYDILDNTNLSKDAVNERCRISHLHITGPYQLMTLCNSQNITNLPIFYIAIHLLKDLLPEVICAIHNNRLIALYSYHRPDENKLVIHEKLVSFLSEYALTAAISMPYDAIEKTHHAYVQTLHTLDEGLTLDSNNNLYLYQDYLPYHALSFIKSEKDFCHPCIYQLQSQDALYDTEYTKTLYYYITNFRNQREAANQMNIHYNTMKYRLKKIQSFLDFSLNDTQEFFLLYLSFMLMRLHGSIF